MLENRTLHAALGVTKRLESPGKVNLGLIEEQTGDCLGKDDIIRYAHLPAGDPKANRDMR